jgi:uncharacterized protein YndB with AHSA1/START domain
MKNEARASSRILGSLRSEDGKGVVRMEDRFDTDIEDLWSALTDPQRLARWYGEVEGELRLGGEFEVRIPDALEATARVDVCEPPERLVVTMRDDDPRPGQPEETVIEAQLTAEADQTVLVVEERGLPLDLVAAYGAGVQIHVEKLADYIAGRASGETEARWEELLPAYQALAADVS